MKWSLGEKIDPIIKYKALKFISDQKGQGAQEN